MLGSVRLTQKVSAAAEIVFLTSILKLKQPQPRCGALRGPSHSGV